MQGQRCFTPWHMTFCAQVVVTLPAVAPSALVALAPTPAGLLAVQRAKAKGPGRFHQKPQSSLQKEQLPGLTLVSQQSLPTLGDCGSSLEDGTTGTTTTTITTTYYLLPTTYYLLLTTYYYPFLLLLIPGGCPHKS